MTLAAFLTTAKPGSTVTLPPATYGPELVRNLSFSPAVTLIATGCVLTAIELRDVTGVHIQGGTWDPGPSAGNKALLGTRVHDVTVSGAAFVGPETAIPGQIYVPGGLYGLSLVKSGNVSVTNSTFAGFRTALMFSETQDFTVTGCDFAHMSSDGIDIASSQRGEVSANTFHDTRIIDKEHPDAIQFWSTAGLPCTSDLHIARNRVCGYTQGINGFDPVSPPGLGFDRIVVEDNDLLIGLETDAIYLVNARDSRVINNRVATLNGQKGVAKFVFKGGSVTHFGNTAGPGAGKPAWNDGPAP